MKSSLHTPPERRATPSPTPRGGRRVRSVVGIAAAALAAAALLTSGCTTGSTRPDAPPKAAVPEEEYELDPMLVRVKDGATIETEALDVEEVFTSAYQAYQARRYEDAVMHYDLIIAYFPDSRFYLPSLYNGGLAYEQLRYWDQAALNYHRIIEAFPTQKEATDAHYRLAHVHAEQGEWEAVVALMTEVMLRDIAHFDRIEAHARRSSALLELGRLDEAEEGYRTLIRLNEQAPEDQKILETSHFIVQSYFGLGRIGHARVAAIPLVLPPERMGEDLEVKAEHFLRAQSNYIRAVRYHHPHWSVAAGYMIGKMYEDFYLDMLTAEIPDDLTDEQVAMYFDELRQQIRPLMERAVQVYERNLSFSQRVARGEEADRWVQQTSMHLVRLRAYLNDPQTQRRAERLVREGRDLAELWDPANIARQYVSDALDQAATHAHRALLRSSL